MQITLVQHRIFSGLLQSFQLRSSIATAETGNWTASSWKKEYTTLLEV
jgi:hypothetical protein